MIDLSTVHCCADITDSLATEAAGSRDDMRALLVHAAKISRPGEGASKILLALGRMVVTPIAWVQGELRADFVASGDKTDADIKWVVGGFLERVFPTVTFDAPLDEFVRAVRLAPRMFQPLLAHAASDDHLVFVSSQTLYDDPPLESVGSGDFDALELDIEVEQPGVEGARPGFDPEIHSRKTAQRLSAIPRDALRSDAPPAKTKPPSDDDLDEGW